VKVRLEDRPETVGVFNNADIAVLRSGKAKKNDPPIPADLAPISGNGKRRAKPAPAEESLPLDPIKFRYREESVVEEPVEEAEAPATQADSKNARRRRRHNKAEVRKEAPAAQPVVEETPAEVPQEAAEEKPKQANHHRRRHHRSHKPKNQGGNAE
jgi:hypothetical protein